MTNYSDIPKPNLPEGESKLPVRSTSEMNDLIEEMVSIAIEGEINEEKCSSEKESDEANCE